jgi:molecular chaperone DnaK
MILGIDLGTTNTCAAVIKNGKPIFVKTGNTDNDKLLPSVVTFIDKNQFLVGEKAKDQYTIHPDSTIKSVKSLMGTSQEVILTNQRTEEKEVFTPIEISAQILSEIKRLAEEQFNKEIERAVITVPAYFNDKARKDTIKAGELAGFEVMRIINEPTAAALSYGIQNKKLKNHYIMVYDLGGGTFDTSIIEINEDIVEVIASDGDRALGGDNFDYALFSYLYRTMEGNKKVDLKSMKVMATILKESEHTKNELSSSAKYKVEIPLAKFEETIYREDFEKIIRDLLNKTVVHCKSVIEKAMLKSSDIDSVLLVGGSSRIPAVRKLLEQELKVPVSQEIDPDLAVVTGAAIQAAIIEGQKVDSVLLDVSPHALSVSCVIEKNGKLVPNYCSKLIKKNAPIPCSVEEIFSTMNDNQNTVRIAIYQGESDFEEGNTLIKELKFDVTKLRKAGETEILVNFSYKLDGTIEVHVREEGTHNKTRHSVPLLNKKLAPDITRI